MKYAWIELNKIKDIAQGVPSAIYHPNIALNYTSIVPDNAEVMDNWDGFILTKYIPPVPIVPPEPPLGPRRDKVWEQIKKIRDHKTQTSGYTAGGKWFHSDTFSRIQQVGLVMMGAGIPIGLQWKTMDGSFISMTQTLAGQVFSSAAASDQALFGYAETLKAQVYASSAPTSIDINAGWPLSYA